MFSGRKDACSWGNSLSLFHGGRTATDLPEGSNGFRDLGYLLPCSVSSWWLVSWFVLVLVIHVRACPWKPTNAQMSAATYEGH